MTAQRPEDPGDSNDHAGSGEDLERRGRFSVPRGKPEFAAESQATIQHGSKPGTRYARIVRKREREFERGDDGTIRVTQAVDRPRTAAQRAWRQVKRIVVGAPLSSEEIEEQRLPKTKALAVFSSDALSSSAYATDEILLVLVLAGTGALTYSIEIALAIGVLFVIVIFSYRQTIHAYPSGGGAYIVARENLGNLAGLGAAAALAVDYVMTVAVSIAAGVFAITSAFPELHAYGVPLSIGAVALITVANLRGIRESGTIFAVPTYLFIAGFIILLVGGFIRLFINPDLTAEIPESVHQPGTQAITLFLLLKAFSSGCAALTGIEAISNGIPAFKKPESRNASTTLVIMGVILGTFFIGLTILAHEMGVHHADEISVPAQIARTVFGNTPIFYFIQFGTALILILAANTSYADFPRLASILAKDKFLPHHFMFRGDRLAFSHGILVLGAASAGLLVVYSADVDALIPLYAFGVFVSFTLSQGGMVVHWLRLRESGWKRSMVINGVGATATAVVAAIIGLTKFADGAWLSMLAMAILAVAFWAIFNHYTGVRRKLSVPEGIAETKPQHRQPVVIPVDEVNRAVLRTLDYARSLSSNVTALHVTDDTEAANAIRVAWESTVLDVPMVIINSPYRSFVAPVLSYIDALDRVDPARGVTIVLPEYLPRWPWQRWLHNQSARRLKRALIERPNVVVIDVPYHLA